MSYAKQSYAEQPPVREQEWEKMVCWCGHSPAEHDNSMVATDLCPCDQCDCDDYEEAG